MIQVRLTEIEGKQLVEQWKASGMDKRAFSRQHGIAYGRFLYWCKRISSLEANTSLSAGLVQLEVIPQGPAHKISISGQNGLILHLDDSERSVSFIKALLTA